MRITLINVSSTLTSDGSRLVSALLKRAGHRVKSIFMARSEPHPYEEWELEPLDDIMKACDLVMIGVYSSYALRAVQVTDFVRKRYPGMKVIWGGPHCISVPELGLRYADGICFSEGDEAVVELVKRLEGGGDYLRTPNMAFRLNGSSIVNDLLPPFTDLDGLPYYDYDLDDQFLLNKGLFQMTKEMFRKRSAGYPYYIPTYYFTTSRGCPHRCAYCNNCRYVAMFGRNPMRFQSVERVIRELEETLERLDFFRIVGFGDDDFFMRPKRDIQDFAEKYRKRVGLPFGVAVSANTYHREKMEMLLDGGLKFIQMGVQSGSQRMMDEVYDRNIKIARTKEVIRQIAPFRSTHKLDFLLDFIIDNPYETTEDVTETYRYIVDLPLHVMVNIFFLAFFPGTPIYDRALKDGIIRPFDEKAFRFYIKSRVQYQRNYETFLILLERYLRRRPKWRNRVPRSLLVFLSSRPIRGLSRLLPDSVYASLSGFVQ
ncbi:MAG: B12-binding domain-containing radical SAM protein [Deltaproteobacteria bacterium]|nr:B12-binding domain-containing radical SAM protein [Deltaproteobacteria bacterium]